ncbi:MAG TPA: hypothetical protein VJK29_04270, partial [Terriglobales bacterium]|nr:hypothetical protein [Terriglobales bacterium]
FDLRRIKWHFQGGHNLFHTFRRNLNDCLPVPYGRRWSERSGTIFTIMTIGGANTRPPCLLASLLS